MLVGLIPAFLDLADCSETAWAQGPSHTEQIADWAGLTEDRMQQVGSTDMPKHSKMIFASHHEISNQ